mgnify:CR=1 FL=1
MSNDDIIDTLNDLIATWEKKLPPDAPNRFLVNIQPAQIDPAGNTCAGPLRGCGSR